MKALSPRVFENLVYDVLLSHGLINATWRTPGADGGRDIQGNVLSADFSGGLSFEKWYVDCKRYESSLSWPVVHEKLAYADNHRSDYLLLCTTSDLSPQCKDEVAQWNQNSRKPQVRHWGGADLEMRVARSPAIVFKYGLGSQGQRVDAAIGPMLQLITKIAGAAYGFDSGAAGQSRAIEYLAGLLELITSRCHDLTQSGRFLIRPFRADQDMFPWSRIVGKVDLRGFDPQ